MHNGFVQMHGEKMAKSEGNVVTIRELLNDWPGEVLRFNMLKTHYRQPFDWTENGLEESARTIEGWRRTLSRFPRESTENAPQEFVAALEDDLNTPRALTAMHQLGRTANRVGRLAGGPPDESTQPTEAEVVSAAAKLRGCLALLGIDLMPMTKDLPEEALELIKARAAARSAKNFEESDRIRDELAKMGVVLHDTKDGTTWEVAR
jgi:cysteinyl-tRNA synthetase